MYLISGGAGFLGLNTARALVADGSDVVITTRRRDDPMARTVVEESAGKITLEVIDLNNPHEVYNLFSRYDFDGVVHTATNHMFARTRATNFTSYNMLFNVLEAASSAVVARFVLASSAAVYLGIAGPWREDMPFPLENVATASALVPGFEITFKRALEMVALDYGTPMKAWDRAPSVGQKKSHLQMETAVVRFGAQCGPFYVSMYNPTAVLAHALAKGHDSLPPDRTLRPFNHIAYVRDNADGLKTVLQAKTLPHRVYNVSSGFQATGVEIAEAAHRIAPEAARRLGLEPSAQASGSSEDYFDMSRMKDDFGWTPRFNTIDLMLSDYVEWLRTNPY